MRSSRSSGITVHRDGDDGIAANRTVLRSPVQAMPRLLSKPSHCNSLVELSRLRLRPASAQASLCVEGAFLQTTRRSAGRRQVLAERPRKRQRNPSQQPRLLTAAQLRDGDQIRIGETGLSIPSADSAGAQRTRCSGIDAFRRRRRGNDRCGSLGTHQALVCHRHVVEASDRNSHRPR